MMNKVIRLLPYFCLWVTLIPLYEPCMNFYVNVHINSETDTNVNNVNV